MIIDGIESFIYVVLFIGALDIFLLFFVIYLVYFQNKNNISYENKIKGYGYSKGGKIIHPTLKIL